MLSGGVWIIFLHIFILLSSIFNSVTLGSTYLHSADEKVF